MNDAWSVGDIGQSFRDIRPMRIVRQAGPRPQGLRTASLILGLLAGRATAAHAQDFAAAASPSAPSYGAPPASGMTTALGEPPRYGLNPRTAPANVIDVALASIFGSSDVAPWRPLPLRTFFTEGWNEPWAPQPDVSGDSQQGWINAADGSFYRLWFFSYAFTNHLSQGGNGNTGAYTIYTPLNRRLELITTIPFVTSQPTLNVGRQIFPGQATTPPAIGHRTSAGFGDLTLTPRVLLFENDDITFVAQTSIQTPTGYRRVGAGQTILSPGLQFWANVAEGWVVRGGFNAGVGTNRQAGGTTLLSQLAVGRVLTPHDTPLFGDLTFYLSGNVFNKVSASETTVTLTPGFRTHLGKDWYFLGGLEVPVTERRPFEESAIFWLMRVY